MAKVPKERLDKLIVDQGLCDTRSQAQGLILAGQVLVNNQKVDKPGTLVSPSVSIVIKDRPRYVSRGGLKLEKALKDFEIQVSGRVCLDVGASSGGFTDCLLQHGAERVHAVDVGSGQLDWKLRQDPRVHVLEKTHIAHLDPGVLIPPPSMAVVDVSFISLKKVLPNTVRCLAQNSGEMELTLVALIKPQFEYLDYCDIGGFDGVVTQSEHHRVILNGVLEDIHSLLPEWSLLGLSESPIQGPKGNREFLLWLSTCQPSDATHSVAGWESVSSRVATLLERDT